MTATLTGRARAVLERFPHHLAVDDATKVFAEVVDQLALELDRRSGEVGRIRKAHRLLDGETEWDVLHHAGLHDLRSSEFEVLRRRLAACAAIADALTREPGTAAAADARAALPATLNVGADVFPAWDGEPDDVAADQRLGAAVGAQRRYGNELDRMQRHVADLVRVHQVGNGTTSAILTAAASHLALGIDEIRSRRPNLLR